MLATLQKLEILADAAKYDASCASSGAEKRDSRQGGLGSTSHGICHSYTPDGRCVSLLKILLTNYCLFDCAYCINRRSSNVARARFSMEEVVRLTMAFYKRESPTIVHINISDEVGIERLLKRMTSRLPQLASVDLR